MTRVTAWIDARIDRFARALADALVTGIATQIVNNWNKISLSLIEMAAGGRPQ